MNSNQHSACDRADLVRDYAFDELARAERQSMEQHLTECSDCAAELDRWRLTTAALRVLPDQEVPRRIAFVSDKVFATNWLGNFWNSAARLGFASACVLAAGFAFGVWHMAPNQPPPVARTVVQTSAISRSELDEAVNKAVALAVDKAHAEDVRVTQAALKAVDSKYETQQRNLLISMQENAERQQKHLKMYSSLLYTDAPAGAAQ